MKVITMNNEIWLPIKETKGCYMVSNYGHIKSIQRNGTKNQDVILKPLLKKDDYYQVNLKFYGKSIWRRINRLVAETFIPNPNNLPCVNHKDGNKLNNCADNLEWCTAKYNTIHYYNNLYDKSVNKGRGQIFPKSVVRIDTDGNIKTFDSLVKAAVETFGNQDKRAGISKACKQNKKYLSYSWKYMEDYYE